MSPFDEKTALAQAMSALYFHPAGPQVSRKINVL
jgi:hypothetical protein